MKKINLAIDYELGGVTYAVTAAFTRHYTTPDATGPYDADWQLRELYVYNDFDEVPLSVFQGIFMLARNKQVPVLSHMEELLRDKL